MTWTYGGDPAANDRDAVRFLVGDTDTNDELITDEEIAWLLTENGNVYSAAAAAAQTIAAIFARFVNKNVGDLSLDASDKHKHYLDLADTLRRKAAIQAATPFAGGISIASKDSFEDDMDRVQPKFTKDLQQYPGTTTANDLRNDN